MDTAIMIANSLITRRLDYCNYFLFNIDDKYVNQLQRVQKSLARVVCKTSKFCHITPVLHSLHWLKIKYILVFKINSLVYKSLHTNQPVYLRELLSLAKNKEPVPQELESLFDLALLKPRLVLVLSMLLLHTSETPFLQKYEQLRRIPSSAKNKRHTSLDLVFHPNGLTSCCSYFDYFDWPWTRFFNMIYLKVPLSFIYLYRRIRRFIYLS